jgi:hypothetical protein
MDLKNLKIGQSVTANEIELTDKDLEDLVGEVRGWCTDHLPKILREAKASILKRVHLTGNEVMRRDHDGNTQVDWLIEKMIGEHLKNGKINF